MQRKMHPLSPLPSIPTATSSSSSSDAKISPAVLLVIVILAIIFFAGGLIHLLVRFFMKRPSIYSFSLSRRYSENASSDALQRQLQQLFRLHDSGLDPDIIDALPVFSYKDIVGLKESSDCAVCLCEFSDQDQLRLLPVCTHAFHVNCIDTWLLSNSTCPLCRNSLVCSDYSLDFSRELQSNDGGSVHSIHDKPGMEEERTVYSVRLGKLRSTMADNEEISSSDLNARRCYSMGSREYVIGDSDLMIKTRSLQISESIVDGDVEAKRISCSNKGESFSISKIWQWSKKGKFTSSLDTNLISGGPFRSVLPLTNKVQAVDENI